MSREVRKNKCWNCRHACFRKGLPDETIMTELLYMVKREAARRRKICNRQGGDAGERLEESTQVLRREEEGADRAQVFQPILLNGLKSRHDRIKRRDTQ